jgi:uncharacterized damage-inducible protein DinB
VILQLGKYRQLAERALAQSPQDKFFTQIGEESNSLAVMVKHMAGNMRSRWTDFLTTDGEKPDRMRDSEFETAEDSYESVMAAWDAGWGTTLDAISSLSWEDLEATVTIRGERHTVIEAINRQLTHYAYHVGQIVFLARHFAGPKWQSLSIPKGKSAEFEVAKSGSRYDVQGS